MATVYTFSIKQADGTIVQIDTNKEPIEKLIAALTALGDIAETSATTGGTGSIHAKTRLMTSQLGNLLTYVDGLEALLTTIDGHITTIDGHVDGVEDGIGASTDAAGTSGGAGSLNAKMRFLTSQVTALQTYTDSIEAQLTTIAGYIDGIEGLLAAATPAGENMIGKVVGIATNPSANFTRPNDTNAYTTGDLMANSTTAGSVVAMQFTVARVAAGSAVIRRARVRKTTTTISNASFRLHLYGADPAASSGISNGDNVAWLTKHATYLGSIDVTMDRQFSDFAQGTGVPNVGGEITVALASGTTVWGLQEARANYGGLGSALEVFTWDLEVWQN